MQIFVKLLSGKTITLEVKPDYTIFHIKELIEEKEDYLYVELIKLMYSTRQLEDQKMLKDYNIQRESVLHLTTYGTTIIIKCKCAELSELLLKNKLQILISFMNNNENASFSQDMSFMVKTKPFNYEVIRKYSDFEWLRDIFSKKYINSITPPLFQRTSNNITSNALIDKKVRLLGKFIEKISLHPLLGRTKIFLDFISIKNDKEFNKFKAYNYKFPASSKEIESESEKGRIAYNCGLTISDCIYKDAESEILKYEEKEKMLKKLTKEYKLLNLQLENIISKIKNIENIWDELYKINTKLYKEKDDITSLAYVKMKEITEIWAKSSKVQINLNNIRIREYFRYQRYEYQAFKDYFAILKEKKRNFDYALEIYEKNKNKSISSYFNIFSYFKNYTEEEFIDIRDMYANYLGTLKKEFKRIKTQNDIMNKENISDFLKDMIDNLEIIKSDLSYLINSLNEIK